MWDEQGVMLSESSTPARRDAHGFSHADHDSHDRALDSLGQNPMVDTCAITQGEDAEAEASWWAWQHQHPSTTTTT